MIKCNQLFILIKEMEMLNSLSKRQERLVCEFEKDLDKLLLEYSKIDLLTKESISTISKKMGMSRQTFYKYLDWVKKHK